MEIGIHLPQYGRVASPEAIVQAAEAAESLGFADVWVSDHIVQPASQDYPSPYLYDPLLTLGWAAAVTSSVGLGTSVLVAPQHQPLQLANALASLDRLSGGRVIAGVGVGWSRDEFAALGQSFDDRGARTDEIIQILRTAWSDDPAGFHGSHYDFSDIRVLPQPERAIPIWVGGMAPAGRRRAARLGDGWHSIGATPDELAPLIAGLRSERPDPEFVFSHRTGWDPQGMEPDLIRREHEAYAAAGVQRMICAPWRKSLSDWLASMTQLAELCGLEPRRDPETTVA